MTVSISDVEHVSDTLLSLGVLCQVSNNRFWKDHHVEPCACCHSALRRLREGITWQGSVRRQFPAFPYVKHAACDHRYWRWRSGIVARLLRSKSSSPAAGLCQGNTHQYTPTCSVEFWPISGRWQLSAGRQPNVHTGRWSQAGYGQAVHR